MKKIFLITLILLYCISQSNVSFAHCDTRNGPVVKAAKEALRTDNVNFVLIWIQQKDESEIKTAFSKTMAVRTISKEAQLLADEYFFETVVRLHRSGEGESYTGLTDEAPDPSVLFAERAIERRSADSILNDLTILLRQGLDKHLFAVLNSSAYDINNVKEGREYVENYIKFLHYVEALYEISSKEITGHTESVNKPGSVKKIETTNNKQANGSNSESRSFYLLLIFASISISILLILLLIRKTRRSKISKT